MARAPSWGALRERALAGDDEHAFKLVDAASLEDAHFHDPSYAYAAGLTTGAVAGPSTAR